MNAREGIKTRSRKRKQYFDTRRLKTMNAREGIKTHCQRLGVGDALALKTMNAREGIKTPCG